MYVSYNSPGWVRFDWSNDTSVSDLVQAAVRRLRHVPGVQVALTAMQVPKNLWNDHTVRILMADGGAYPAAPEAPKLWETDAPMYNHQREGVDFLVRNGGGFLADEMGLGKTRTAIVAAESIVLNMASHYATRPRVIVGPSYTRQVWRHELLKVGAIEHPDEFFAFSGRRHIEGVTPVNWDAKWMFIHYEIVNDWASIIWTQLDLSTVKCPVAIADEVHWAKNKKAKRAQGTKAVAGIALNRILLSGTPMENRPRELWFPLSILDGGTPGASGAWGSEYDFRRRYCGATRDNYGLRDGPPTHTEELQRRMTGRYLRRTVAQVGIDLPKRTRQIIHAEWSIDEQARKRYDKIASEIDWRELTDALLEARASTETLKILASLRKLISEQKLPTTVDYVADLMVQGESVVVFTWQRKIADAICKGVKGHLRRRRSEAGAFIKSIHGALPQEEREKLVRQFQEPADDPWGRVLCATTGALREGVTLTKARYVVMHDLDWVPAVLLQAEARVHRISQDRPVTSTWVIVKDSIDQLFARVLIEKGGALNDAMDMGAAHDAVSELGLREAVGLPTFAQDVESMFSNWIGAAP